MYYLYVILAAFISMILFSILFNGLNMSVLKVFVPFQKFTASLKRKKLYYVIASSVMIFISILIKESFNLNYIEYGIILGMIISLTDIIFDNSFKRREN